MLYLLPDKKHQIILFIEERSLGSCTVSASVKEDDISQSRYHQGKEGNILVIFKATLWSILLSNTTKYPSTTSVVFANNSSKTFLHCEQAHLLPDLRCYFARSGTSSVCLHGCVAVLF